MIRRLLSRIKHRFNLYLIKQKKIRIGNDSLIKSPYEIYGGNNIIIGEHVSIQQYSKLCCFDKYAGKEYKPEILIGNNVFSNRFLTILSAGKISIGDDTFLGSHVLISNENHGTNPEYGCYGLQELSVSDVTIGKNCWIGDHCVILPGVAIGDYSIIGAGSIVTKSVPPYTIAVGNPARIIKQWDVTAKTWKGVEHGYNVR